jgi:hypothetical protein
VKDALSSTRHVVTVRLGLVAWVADGHGHGYDSETHQLDLPTLACDSGVLDGCSHQLAGNVTCCWLAPLLKCAEMAPSLDQAGHIWWVLCFNARFP